jgi:hypothetical protein
MTNTTKNQKNQKHTRTANVLETLKDAGRDIGSNTVNTLENDLLKKVPGDFMDQLFGPRPDTHSGEIYAGESLEIKDVLSGKRENEELVTTQLHIERRLRVEQEHLVNKKTNELRLQLKALIEEIQVLAIETSDLTEETVIASMQAPIEPGVYHVIFFEKLLEFIKSFRKKIEEAKVWLHSANARAAKKNRWGANYKKHGAKYLLSGEHYLSRSAG